MRTERHAPQDSWSFVLAASTLAAAPRLELIQAGVVRYVREAGLLR